MKGIQSEWKEFKSSAGARSEVKGAQGEQNLKLRAKESENQIRAKQNKKGAWREEACANGCWGGLFVIAVCLFVRLLFVPGEDSWTRKELNFNK